MSKTALSMKKFHVKSVCSSDTKTLIQRISEKEMSSRTTKTCLQPSKFSPWTTTSCVFQSNKTMNSPRSSFRVSILISKATGSVLPWASKCASKRLALQMGRLTTSSSSLTNARTHLKTGKMPTIGIKSRSLQSWTLWETWMKTILNSRMISEIIIFIFRRH